MNCILCESVVQDVASTFVVRDGKEEVAVCGSCVTAHEGPGAYEGYAGERLATLLVLDRWSLDGSEDAYGVLPDEMYVARFGRFVFSVNDHGFRAYSDYESPEKAEIAFDALFAAQAS